MKSCSAYILILSLLGNLACTKTDKSSLFSDTSTVRQDSSSITHEVPAIDDYLVETIPDTAVQDISGRLVLLIRPTQEQLDKLSNEYGDEDFSTIMDDASFYQSRAASLIDSLGIKALPSQKRFVRYSGTAGKWELDLHKQNSPWLVIFFDPEQKPEVVPAIEVTREKIEQYFN